MEAQTDPAKQRGLHARQMGSETAAGTTLAAATEPVPQAAICRRGSWKTIEEVELETLKWIDRFNNMCLLGPIGNIPPAKAEEANCATLNTLNKFA
jgi:hypothetical protein